MKKLAALLIGVVFALPIAVGCEENERKVERHETIHLQGEPQPIVTPDAPQK